MDTVFFAFSLGLFSGISPGPLMTLVISSTLERGFGAGAKTAIAPLLTDLPVILLSLLLLRRVPEIFMAAVTTTGGLFVIWIGTKTLKDAALVEPSCSTDPAPRRDVARGALVNILSPHPWLFWFTVGTPHMLQRWPVARWESIAFLVTFVTLLVGCKIALAWAVSRGRRFLGTEGYRYTLTGCGVVLIGFGLLLLWQGWAGLGLL